MIANHKLPNYLSDIYSNLTYKERIYIKIRWRLCPYEKIEALLPNEGLIVDIGCGYGLLSNLIAVKSYKRYVIGVDSSETGILTAQKTIKERMNIKFLLQDVATFALPSCCAIVLSDVFHHISTPLKENLLRKIYQTLKTDGVLIIQDVNTVPYWKFWFAYATDLLQYPRERLFYQSANEIEEIIKIAGFNVDTIEAHKGYPVADVIFLCRK